MLLIDSSYNLDFNPLKLKVYINDTLNMWLQSHRQHFSITKVTPIMLFRQVMAQIHYVGKMQFLLK